MRFQCSALVWVAMGSGCFGLAGCEDEARLVRPMERIEPAEEGQPQPGPDTLDDGAQRQDAAPVASARGCAPAECPALMALGGVVPGCCQNDGACGGLVLFNGLPLCAPPNIDNLVAAMEPVLMPLSAETVMPDAACSEREILGTRLPGCCDVTGVCGVSTAPVAAGSPGAIPGLELPVTCVSPDEATRLGGGMAVLGAWLPQPCGGTGSGPADAGASDAG